MKLLSSIVFSSLLVACAESATPTITVGDDEPGDESGEADGGDGTTSVKGRGIGADDGVAAPDRGRAYGVSVDALSIGGSRGVVTVPATPDTDVENPSSIVHLPLGIVNDGVFEVATDVAMDGDGFGFNLAVATTNGLEINLPGILHITAGTIVASAQMTDSFHDGTYGTTSGSTIQDLTINGVTYADIDRPTTIPLLGLGEVRLLETHGDGDAWVEVNAIHVVLYDLALTPLLDESLDVVVAHAEAESNHHN